VWDQIRWREPVAAVGDTHVTMAAIAAATERIRLGPLVTPLARRRPVKVARETVALDLLSGGRLTLGVGLGADRFAREYSTTVRSSTTAAAPGCSRARRSTSRAASRPLAGLAPGVDGRRGPSPVFSNRGETNG
jgi:Luciferase-like monooxygenase